MNQTNHTGPVEKITQAQTNLTYIEGLAQHRTINRRALQKAIDDTKELLETLSYQLQQRMLT
ncbi:MAG: hypothetical protein O7B35_07520 [Deltaproteobacteria bacterium]|nr:hypothetical protein [Deltaproteobacteria bacterium]